MKPGTLDVIVPAHNAGRFLGATLQSVALQHVLPRSVIVVDDRSTDDTAAVAVACAADYADFLPIRLLHNRGPRGPSAARNLAIRRSDAEFVALLDADDLAAPAHHQLLLSAIRWLERPDLGRSLAFGAASALMILSKFTVFLFFPAALLPVLTWRLWIGGKRCRPTRVWLYGA